jgi:putative spermidine/putrescine transport system substrate-binding protein
VTEELTRRSFLGATCVGAAGLTGMLPLISAHASVTLTGVQWGGPWVEAATSINANQDNWNVNWELHTGGSATIIPKIRAVWPSPLYDFVAQWSLLYPVWAEQGWPEVFRLDEMPNLRDLPEEIFYRNEHGDIINAPMSLAASTWGYRKDLMPVELNAIEDLLHPDLRGKVIVRDAVAGNGMVVMFARAAGGDERNMEPGWDFLKRLAQSGNIGRVASTEVDFINALTTGECVVGFWNAGSWRKVEGSFPCEYVIRDVSEAPGLQVGLHDEGYMIPHNAANKEEAKRYVDWFLSPENNEEYNRAIGYVPVNLKSQAGEFAQRFFFTDEADRRRYTHPFAFDVLVQKQTEMIQQFETEIVPLLK